MLAEGADAAGHDRSIPVAKAMRDGLLAYAANGEALRPSQGYPAAPAAARLRGQHERQVAAPPQGRRRTLAHPAGDSPLRRPDARRHGARVHLRHGGQVGHHLPLWRATPPRPRLLGDHRTGLVGTREDHPGRRLDRRRRRPGPRRHCRSRCCRSPGPASACPGRGTASRPACRAGRSTRPATSSRRWRNWSRRAASTPSTTSTGSQTWAVAADGEVTNVYA